MSSTYIDGLILRMCKQPRSFEFISMNLSGFDPVELFAALKNLETQNKIVHISGLWYLKKKQKESIISKVDTAKTNFFNEHIGFFGLFDKPHPLDFEWRNSTGSLDYLINTIQKNCEVNENILFLGFPTLFASACIKDIPQHVTLVEKNKPIVNGLRKLNINKERFKIIEADIFNVNPIKVGKYYTVIMDPPWYSPHFYQFMWLASKCVEVGGIVGISLPPINTRPDIYKERIKWFSFCEKHGLCLENLYAQKLHYAMPFFEYNAFRSAGIKDILPFWRKGDLALFRKVKADTFARPKLDEKRNVWIEKEIDGVRIRIKIESGLKQKSELQINHLLKGDILPTVSTRDNRRKEANVWTSGNRIFKVTNTKKFILSLDNLIKGQKKGKEQDVTELIKTITEIEKKEYNNYLDWLYHEMERQVD